MVEEIAVNEAYRIYHYPGGYSYRVLDVIGVSVSESGNHRLSTKSGEKAIVAPGWHIIVIDTPEWSF
jgi:hypothetical protein